MTTKSHIDMSKLNRVPSGCPFEYKDVVQEGLSDIEKTEDGTVFKLEVQDGKFPNVTIARTDTDVVQYQKL